MDISKLINISLDVRSINVCDVVREKYKLFRVDMLKEWAEDDLEWNEKEMFEAYKESYIDALAKMEL